MSDHKISTEMSSDLVIAETLTGAVASEVRFGRLVLIERNHARTPDGHVKSLWRCDCGTRAAIAYSRVKQGNTVSCGCFARQQSSIRATKHGRKDTPEYYSWVAMKRRCEVPSDKDFLKYGARGVTVCAEWSASFVAFLDHVGPRPAGTTLDRIDSREGYNPGNVRWGTPEQQGRNRRGTFFWHIRGSVFETITDAACAFRVSEQTISRWVNGQFDKRRNRMVPPRPDCSVVPRYAQC